ncbi:hypothetical protein BH18ACT2_BH18ACT2_16060 [soil metagenome]
MTASARRRRRATLVAAIVAVVATLAAAGLAVAGVLTLYNSTEGTSAADSTVERVFPVTPTGVLGVVDAEGELASMVVLVGSPAGTGGTIVTVPVNVDASAGAGEERLPIDETLRLDGASSLLGEVEAGLGVGMDVAEVVDDARLAELLAPIGPIEVELPDEITDADGRVVAPAGMQLLEPAEAAAVLAARDGDRRAADRYPDAVAVWSAIAATAGSIEPSPGTADSIEGLLGSVLAGPATQRSLSFDELQPEQNQRQADVVRVDRIEVALIFGQIAPGRMAAPNPALTFRIESPFTDDALGAGRSRAEVAYQAISVIVFAGGNILSVSTAEGEVAPTTQVLVSDDSLLGEVEGIDGLIGPVDVGVAEERIAGVDAVIRLGSSFLEQLPAPSSPPDETATTEAGDTTVNGDD